MSEVEPGAFEPPRLRHEHILGWLSSSPEFSRHWRRGRLRGRSPWPPCRWSVRFARAALEPFYVTEVAHGLPEGTDLGHGPPVEVWPAFGVRQQAAEERFVGELMIVVFVGRSFGRRSAGSPTILISVAGSLILSSILERNLTESCN